MHEENNSEKKDQTCILENSISEFVLRNLIKMDKHQWPGGLWPLWVFLLSILMSSNFCSANCNYTSIEGATITPGPSTLIQCSAYENAMQGVTECEFSIEGNCSVVLTDKSNPSITTYVALFAIYFEGGDLTYTTITIKEQLNEIDEKYNVLEGFLDCGKPPKDRFQLLIIPTNDNKPIFDQPQYTLDGVSEKFPLGYDTLKVYGFEISASDADTPNDPSSAIDFDIIAGDDNGTFTFQTDPDNCNSSRCLGQLLIVSSIDYREHPQYLLTLQVKDEGDPPQSSTALLTVNIQDEDNLDPIFEHQFYYSNVTLIDGSTYDLSTSPDVIHAYDQDTGIDSPMTYQLLFDTCGPTCDAIKEAFAIDPDTATIRFHSDVDIYVVKNQLAVFEVQATQVDNPDHSAVATISVFLPPPPPLTSTSLKPISTTNAPITTTVSSTTNCPTVLTTSTTCDCPITDCPTAATVTISSSPGTCPTQAPYTYGNTTETIFVSVLLAINSQVAMIEANDDVGNYEYNLQEDSPYFGIDPKLGEIYVLDYLQLGPYELTVIATSTSQPTVTYTAKVNIQTTNDQEAAVFPQNYFEVNVEENDNTTQILADLSSPYENSQTPLSYQIADVIPYIEDTFWVDPESGVVTVNQSLDYENQTTYDIIVEAVYLDTTTKTAKHWSNNYSKREDKGPAVELKNNQALVRVFVQDTDDQSPVFINEGIVDNQMKLAISLYTSTSQALVQLQTNDDDTYAVNKEVYYFMDGVSNEFYINRMTGLLMASPSLKELQNSGVATFAVQVKATNDIGGSLNLNTLSIEISILQQTQILVTKAQYPVDQFDRDHGIILGNLSSTVQKDIRVLKWVAIDESSTKTYLYAYGSNGPMSAPELMSLVSDYRDAFTDCMFDTSSATTYDQTSEADVVIPPPDDNTGYIVGISILASLLGLSLIAGAIYGWKVYNSRKKLRHQLGEH